MTALSEIGIGLIGIGFVFYFMGVLWFLDRGFLAIANVSLPTAFNSSSLHC
jgi:hypothetical protein